MEEAEFDKFADEYRAMHAANIALSGESPDFFAEYKVRDIARIYGQRPGRPAAPAILDFGAGVGTSVPFMRKYFPNARITCLDVSTKSLEIGRARFSNDAEFEMFDGTHIPFDDDRFHIVFAACVFHHVDHDEHVALLREFRRILVPGGFAFVFEHNPLNPLTVRAVNTCPFDENARLIRAGTMRRRFVNAGFARVSTRYRIFFPGALRAFRPLEAWMGWLPLAAQYNVFAVK
jgi:ubiquinone/menaquinone biosynthesis C-methylase UbiE